MQSIRIRCYIQTLSKVYFFILLSTLISRAQYCGYDSVCLGPEMIINGNFEAGNMSFLTELIYDSISLVASGRYAVVSDPNPLHPAFFATDRTNPGIGKFCAVNGSNVSRKAWYQSIIVVTNTDYIFSVWVNNLIKPPASYSDPVFQLKVNDSVIAGPTSLPESPDEWIQLCGIWNSGADTNIELSINSASIVVSGNDYAFDDVSFREIKSSEIRDLILNTDTIICNGDSIILDALGKGNISWNPSAGLSDSNSFNPIANPLTTTTYIATLLDSFGCQSTDSITIEISAPFFFIQDTVMCKGDSFILYLPNEQLTYIWNTTDSLSDLSTNTPIIKPDTTTSYILIAKDSIGCAYSDSIMVIIHSLPEIDAGEDRVIKRGESVVLDISPVIDQGVYEWMPSEGLDCIDCTNLTVKPKETTTYYVIVKDSNNCTSIDTIIIYLEANPILNVPNAFTPNKDGKNEVFNLLNTDIQNLITFEIYNRWGQMIFQTNNLKQGWDGVYNQKLQESGIYIYRIKAITETNESIDIQGNVILLY